MKRKKKQIENKNVRICLQLLIIDHDIVAAAADRLPISLLKLLLLLSSPSSFSQFWYGYLSIRNKIKMKEIKPPHTINGCLAFLHPQSECVQVHNTHIFMI